ncbi:MAG TPA: class I SAM-dependent methyltransferase [Solirubrobacteraceae bacterium]|nr:class I SAM-dependent methyltransferase [Solirubrobacteraceae bacterium]
MSAPEFERAWAVADQVEGWLSREQARLLFERAAALAPRATIVEIGSFRGRSTIVLALAAPAGASVLAIDPHAGGDRGPRELAAEPARGRADLEAFEANLAAAGVRQRVVHLRLSSARALAPVTRPIDLLYVDGAHRPGPALHDITRYGALVAPGGVMLVHDAFSSVGVTAAILARLLGSAQFAYAGRVRSLAEYRRALGPRLPASVRARGAVAQLAQLPWFAGNVAIKLALVAGRPALARALGLPAGDPWPY